jgi:TolB-like protein
MGYFVAAPKGEKTMMRILLAASLAVLFAVSPGLCDDGAAEATGNKTAVPVRPRLVPVHRAYFYNYPHALPPDYVFRTGRVFSPASMQQSLLGGLLPAGAGDGAAVQVPDSGEGEELNARIAHLGRALIADAGGEDLDEHGVAVTTFVNLDNLYATSSLGRYLGEKLLGELRRAGLAVVDVRKTPGLLVSRQHGEYGLSRDMDELGFVQDVQVLLVGTYTVTNQELLVNARLLRNADNRVLAAAGMVLPLNRLTARLLADESMPAATAVPVPVTVRAFAERTGRSAAEGE